MFVILTIFAISVHPVIRVPNQLVGAPLGTDVKLECYVEAFPKSISYWVRGTGKKLLILCPLQIHSLTKCNFSYFQLTESKTCII